MDIKQAQQLIQQIFTQPFELESYRHFVLNLLNHYEERNGHYTGNYIPDAFKQHVNQYWRIGKYVDPDGNQLDLLVVEVRSLVKLERARSSLRNFAVNRLKQFEKEASLIAFYAQDDQGADWRFSFVKIEHEAYQDDKGKVKLKQELTPARRYSYLVGQHENSHTVCRQLLPVLEMDFADPKVEEIEAAFSIEKITDEFFDQYKALFQKLTEHLKKQPGFKQASHEETDQAVSRFAKKLLGQIVFLYFLQKKGWLGATKGKAWGEGSKRFLRERYQQTGKEGGNYYRDFLQYLFYEALACKREEQDDPGYYERFQCRVPFLNGGLFEADYDWRRVNIAIPNSLFHNDEKTKAGDVGTGILDVFDRYNFTIKEDEPLDKEVAVDPEMLGKVFENMLEITERKSKGAFYTPREIVHYMCQESLIHYLDNRLNTYAISYEELDSPQTSLFANTASKVQLKLTAEHQDVKVPKEDLETLIRKGHLALENDTRVLSKGKETETYRFQLPEAVRSHANEIEAALADIKVCDPAIGSGAFPVGLLHEIVNARQALAPHSGNHQGAYDLKRHAIAESIYGVDIDASAIDIARLRLWLSLIVDEEDYGTIEALPNLDYKIVQGNALESIEFDLFSKEYLLELEKKKKEFFTSTDHKKKRTLGQHIDLLFQKISNNSKTFDFKLYFSEIWHDRNGFDIVIQNPPYISHDAIDKNTKLKLKQFDVHEPFADIFCYLLEKSIEVLADDGVLSAITSNSYLRSNYGLPLRKYLYKNTNISCLLNVQESQLFKEATVNAAIILANKRKSDKPAKVVSGSIDGSLDIHSYINSKYFSLDQGVFSRPSWQLLPRKLMSIILKMEGENKTLDQLKVKIRLGIATGDNGAFVIDEDKRNDFINLDSKNKNIIKPILRGRDIQRYAYNNSLYILLAKNGVDVKSDYPVLYDYFDSLGDKFKKRGAKGKHWTNLRACSFFEDFKHPKIVWIELSDIGRFAYVKDEMYLLNSAYFLVPPPQTVPCYLLAVLNSSVIRFYLVSSAETSGVGTSRWINNYVKSFPVAIPGSTIQQKISFLAEYCMEANRSGSRLIYTFFDQLLDSLIYELYFTDELKAAGKDIFRHLGELTPLTDQMSDEEKLAIVQREFDRLYDPSHSVRNIIETLDSVEVVRTIREALQRK